MFNTGGIECEVGELLYGLVRALKPKHILETGTYHGLSSTYMALGLKEIHSLRVMHRDIKPENIMMRGK